MKGLTKIKAQFGPTTAALLRKQCQIIGVDYNKIDFQDQQWYSKYEWTEAQETKYKKWFINYLYNKLSRVKEIATLPYHIYKSKKRLADLWRWWNLMYGWKRSDWK